jgi:hypothetical protein
MTFIPSDNDLDAAEAGMCAYQIRQMKMRVCTSLRGYANAALIAIHEANKAEPMSEDNPEDLLASLIHQMNKVG